MLPLRKHRLCTSSFFCPSSTMSHSDELEADASMCEASFMPTSKLPSVLERMIFEISMVTRPVTIPKLMRVAHRVKEWCSIRRLRDIAATKSPSFLRGSLHNVMFLDTGGVVMHKTIAQEMIAHFTGIENIFRFTRWPVRRSLLPGPGLETLPLHHLYCSYQRDWLRLNARLRDFPLPNLTHVSLMGDWGPNKPNWEDCKGLASLPRLTHLAFNFYNILPLATRLLDECRSLCAFIILVLTLPNDYCEETEALSADRGALTGVDFWTRAHDFITKRRSGGIPHHTKEINLKKAGSSEMPDLICFRSTMVSISTLRGAILLSIRCVPNLHYQRRKKSAAADENKDPTSVVSPVEPIEVTLEQSSEKLENKRGKDHRRCSRKAGLLEKGPFIDTTRTAEHELPDRYEYRETTSGISGFCKWSQAYLSLRSLCSFTIG
ncbi:hypothetical protein DFH09DRAFT_1090595 [Mycena vulgaris]|nr:hypothetical protein DFH09DRAFT_1090595 [Mycena vulgaris]